MAEQIELPSIYDSETASVTSSVTEKTSSSSIGSKIRSYANTVLYGNVWLGSQWVNFGKRFSAMFIVISAATFGWCVWGLKDSVLGDTGCEDIVFSTGTTTSHVGTCMDVDSSLYGYDCPFNSVLSTLQLSDIDSAMFINDIGVCTILPSHKWYESTQLRQASFAFFILSVIGVTPDLVTWLDEFETVGKFFDDILGSSYKTLLKRSDIKSIVELATEVTSTVKTISDVVDTIGQDEVV